MKYSRAVFSKKYEIYGYQVEVSNSTRYEFIKKNWISLEKENDLPFFLTWNWISTWISTYAPQLITVTASYNNSVVAIGLFTESIEVRHNVIRSHQIRLHQIGDPSKDQIWIEYNDFVCSKEHEANAVNACFEILQRSEFGWDEIVLSMIIESRANQIMGSHDLAFIDSKQPCYITNLDVLTKSGQSYLVSLSSNSRYQIKKSIRIYEKEFGTPHIHVAENKEQALEYFHMAGSYHLQRWSDSGFKNPFFIQFHENLISNSFHDGSIQLLRLSAGKESIGILYYHVIRKQVFFYLHGLNYHQNKKLKPGLVAHALATDFFIKRGMKTYDYMGGYSQYKTQLAKKTENLVSVVFQRPRSRFRLENIARRVKKLIIPTEK